MSSVRVENHMIRAGAEIKQRTSMGIRRATTDFRRIARAKTPFKSGDLANRFLEQVLGLTGAVAWLVVYAPYQERGARADGTYRIRKRPSGGQSKFAESSAHVVAANGQKYFGGP